MKSPVNPVVVVVSKVVARKRLLVARRSDKLPVILCCLRFKSDIISEFDDHQILPEVLIGQGGTL
jgi:hypothetical protein